MGRSRSAVPLVLARRPLALALVLMLAAACGSSSGGRARTGPRQVALLPQDQALALTEVEVRGLPLAPEALTRPAMIQTVTRRAGNLAAQRRRVAARKVPDPQDVQLLVTLLWNAADRLTATDPQGATALREEARLALRALRKAAGEKTDARSLEMLGSAELWLGDDAAAIPVYEELVRRFPDDARAKDARTWLGVLYLRQRRFAPAAELVAAWNLPELDDRGAYVLAWTALATGQAATARAAMAQAARGWSAAPSRPVVQRDLLFVLARTGTPVDEAARIIAEVAGNSAQQRYVMTFRLSEAYEKAGRFAHAADTLDAIVSDLAGDQGAGQGDGQVPADDLVGFRFRQADHRFRLNDPAGAAERAIQAHQALGACGERCGPQTAAAVIDRLLKLAQFSHTVFARSLDPRHHDAARRLYEHYLAIEGRPDAETVRGYQRNLAETRASSEPGSGKHDAEVMLNLVMARREVLAACYERVLLGEPTLEGSLELILEVDQEGAVTAVASQPAPGGAGLGAVARCAVDRLASWSFPSRTVPGKTTLRAPVRFSLQVERAPAAEPGGAAEPGPGASN